MDKLYIVIPAYNEEENISAVVEDWYPVIEKHHGDGESRLVIIDDGSKDSTYEILKASAQDKPLLLPLTKLNALRLSLCFGSRSGLHLPNRLRRPDPA